jgi:uncharacterized protein YdeI (YjbR/CyaY-like superfamily)
MPPKSFRTQAAWRAWLEKHHATERELILRLFKVHAKHRGIGYREALDEALCFGWIDGVLHRIDEDSFRQRWTPRKAKSKWSHVNIRRFKELKKEGRVHPAGLAVFDENNVAHAPYSYESPRLVLDPAFEKRLRANRKAWTFWESEPPGRKRTVVFWIMSAKKPETRDRRFSIVLDKAARGISAGVLETKK